MKLIEAGAEQLIFELEAREKTVLAQVLKLYPLVPVAHQRLSKSEEQPESQQMLDEALASQRRENKKLVETFLRADTIFRKVEKGWQFFLPASQVEWFLQVLNDVRVGSWLSLGSPDGPPQMMTALNDKTAPYFWAMQVADHFQVGLLNALGDGGMPGKK